MAYNINGGGEKTIKAMYRYNLCDLNSKKLYDSIQNMSVKIDNIMIEKKLSVNESEKIRFENIEELINVDLSIKNLKSIYFYIEEIFISIINSSGIIWLQLSSEKRDLIKKAKETIEKGLALTEIIEENI